MALDIIEQETRLIASLDTNIESSFAGGVADPSSEVLKPLTGYDRLSAQNRSLGRKGIESTLAPLIAALRTTAPTYFEPVLQNGFLNLGGDEQPVQYYLNWDGEIVIRGMLLTPPSPNNKVIFTLPAGLWPQYNLHSAEVSNAGLGIVRVYASDGAVYCVTATGGGSLSLNIRFRPG